jgi:hypothetical protein
MEILIILIIAAAIIIPATKTGRRALGNFTKSAHKATGWRTPRDAVHHYSGRAGALTGRLTASGARAGRRAAGTAGQRAASAAGRRWRDRLSSGGLGPMLWRDVPGTAKDADGPADSQAPASAAQAATEAAPAGGHAASQPGPGSAPAWLAGGVLPGPVPGAGQPPAATGGGQSPTEVTPAPTGAEPRRKPMPTRYAINLEPPTTDGEFLESCVALGDVLKSLAEQIGNWADGLGALNLPQSVLNPLHQVSDGITEAAAGAAQAAKAFEDEFEDARDVASRGMTITGQDAA